jgi:ElaB/YqjD/DUF883 family membrane-anchored ribosome-binding protein
MANAQQTAKSGVAGSDGGASGSSQSVTDQTKEAVKETAEHVQEQVGQKAQEVRAQAGTQIRDELDTRSTQAGEQVTATADAIRRVGKQLREEGREGTAKYADEIAERAERLGGYLKQTNADRLLRDVESFARRQPWLTAVTGVAVGFLSSRFLKASSAGRYQQSVGQNGASPRALPAPRTSAASNAGSGAADPSVAPASAGRSGGRGQL